MALTYSAETGSGASQVFDIRWESSLGYLDKTHVYVYTGSDYRTNSVPFTWVNDNQVQCTVTGEFTIRRVVPRNVAINNYVDGAILRERNLDDSYAQLLMVFEEIHDGFTTLDNENLMNVVLNMLGNRITRVGAPVLGTDAVNLDAANTILTNSRASTENIVETTLSASASANLQTFPAELLGVTAIGSVRIWINGVKQEAGAAYAVTPTAVSFSEVLDVNDRVTFATGTEVLVTTQLTTSRTRTIQLATDGQTVFTAPTYNPTLNELLVMVNGVVQIPAAYTAEDGETITLSEAVVENDSIDIIRFI